MISYEFDGRVAVVTGAGRGIGRAYALLLGQHGAKVVVNDLGGSTRGTGHDPAPAQDVADQITKAGGTAIADSSDVSTAEGGQRAVDAAVSEFGRVDIVVNNAGNVIYGGLPEVEVSVLDAVLAVHVRGTFNVTRAAWPHMLAQNYGRVVLTGSTGMFGMPDNLSYATAKSAMIGMAQSMTVSAGDRDIKVNVIAPHAWTRMAGDPSEGMDELRKARPAGVPRHMEPELVAPMAAFLAHESCPVSAGVYLAGAGRFARLYVAVTNGYLYPGDEVPAIEDVAANWAVINDEAGYYVPTSTLDASAHYMSHQF
ncbi:MAG: SDR family NAD(P)-dependent oxidoreductase [Streptosporangiaceae bacterium]|jgi:NAD(P)-dependent dehydrogenase (short-subunit alcohol dehydrogenase family)